MAKAGLMDYACKDAQGRVATQNTPEHHRHYLFDTCQHQAGIYPSVCTLVAWWPRKGTTHGN